MSFEETSIRERLQALGAQCEDLAAVIEKLLKAKLSEPMDASAKSTSTRGATSDLAPFTFPSTREYAR